MNSSYVLLQAVSRHMF